jgi:tetratricopeptide (TPR) repeat protein
LSEGFSLFVAVVNRPVTRDALIRELAESVPDLKFKTVRLSQTTVDPLDDVIQQAGDPPQGPVMVIDFDVALPSDLSYHPILEALNFSRPKWPVRFRYPIIFWVPEYVLTILAREAPDFLDWRSMTVFFIDGTERDLIPFQSDLWEGGINNSFTRVQRLERMLELESRLKVYGTKENDAQIVKAQVEWLNELGLHRMLLGESKKAIELFNEAIELCRKINDRSREGGTFRNLGTAWRNLGDASKAISFSEQALAIAQEIDDRKDEVKALRSLGATWLDKDDPHKAIDFSEQALAIAREIGDRRVEGSTLGCLGAAWFNLCDYRKSISYHERALANARDTADRVEEGAALGNLGAAWCHLGDQPKGITYYEQALFIVREIGDRRFEAIILRNLGITNRALGDTHGAIGFYNQSLSLSREIGHKQIEMRNLRNLGDANSALGSIQVATGFYEQALTLAQKLGDQKSEKSITADLESIRAKSREPNTAISHLENAFAILESSKSPHAKDVQRILTDLRTETKQPEST